MQCACDQDTHKNTPLNRDLFFVEKSEENVNLLFAMFHRNIHNGVQIHIEQPKCVI